MRFVARRPALARLMFGPQLPNREQFPQLGEAADLIGSEIGDALHNSALGLGVWAAVHGLAMLILENVIDLGQRRSGLDVLPSRAEILLRSLFTVQRGLARQKFCGITREIGEDAAGARALERHKAFQHHAVAVEPAALDRAR